MFIVLTHMLQSIGWNFKHARKLINQTMKGYTFLTESIVSENIHILDQAFLDSFSSRVKYYF
jgi:hypothetical protein